MADKDFEVTMVDPNGGEFVAGSPEVVARLKSRGYKEKVDEQESAVADEASGVDGSGESKPDGSGESKPDGDGPQVENPKPADANKQASANSPNAKTGGGAGKPGTTK